MATTRTFTCNECSTVFTGKGNRERKYCGKECSNLALRRMRRKERVTRTCPTCQKEFQAKKWSKTIYCRVGCATMAQKREGRVTKDCEFCGEEFNAPKSRNKRYCSRSCGNRAIAAKKRAKLVELTCEVCETKFEVKPHIAKRGRKFCSRDCGCKSMGRNNVLQPKVRPCGVCGIDVSVPRNASDEGVRCPGHRVVLVKDEERECLECGESFIAEKGRLRTRAFCSKTCSCRHIGKQNEAILKTWFCQGCDVDVVVPRSTANTRVFCVSCKAENRKAARKRTYANEKQRKIERTLQPINKPASRPYEGYTLLHLEFNGEERHWFVAIRHNGMERDQKLLLAQYILSVQRGRFLREDENVNWIDGDETNDNPENLEIRSALEESA